MAPRNVTTDSADRLRDRPTTDLPHEPRLCAVTRQDGKLDGIGVEAPRIHRAACERPVRTGRQDPIAATAISSLPKCVCKRAGIACGMLYRKVLGGGTIYADLCGIRN